MITISFYSYKGGVGRSLTLANLGVYLAQFGATVAIADFDLEAPGLQYKFQPDSPVPVGGRGIAGLLADVSRGVHADDLNWDIAVDITEESLTKDASAELLEQASGRLLLVPAGNPLEPTYWNDLGAIDWYDLFSSEHRRGVPALARLKQQLVDQYSPDILLVDSRTGITPGGGVVTTLLPDVVVVMMLNTAEHMDGSRLVVAAVTESGDENAPTVVPVLSRYTDPALGRPRARPPSARTPEPDERELLDELREALVSTLPEMQATKVHSPLVLHADLALQHTERLAFGKYAAIAPATPGQALLDDYLRLFAAVVPSSVFVQYVTGVRNRVRSILLDSPDDAKRTLESLAVLVADEQSFVDLIKLYVLRDDLRGMLTAAERLFHIHERTIVHPALSSALRTMITTPRAARFQARDQISPDFVAAYWREEGSGDHEWGAAVSRYLADSGQDGSARQVAHEVVAPLDGDRIGQVIAVISQGAGGAEKLAVDIANESFDAGVHSPSFIAAAVEACRYRPSSPLAQRLLESPSNAALSDADRIGLLFTAGNKKEAGIALAEVSDRLDPDSSGLGEWESIWPDLLRHAPHVRSELRTRNPALLRRLEGDEDE